MPHLHIYTHKISTYLHTQDIYISTHRTQYIYTIHIYSLHVAGAHYHPAVLAPRGARVLGGHGDQVPRGGVGGLQGLPPACLRQGPGMLHCTLCIIELETKVHPKVRDHGPSPS